MDENQNALILKAKRGDQESFTELYQQTRKMAFFTAMRYVKNEADTADVMQNAYMAAFNRLHTFDENRSFEPWLRKIVVNQALNFLRGKKDIVIGEERVEEIIDDEGLIPANYLEEKEKRREILDIVGRLPHGQRLAITLYYFEGMAIAAIADTMGVKPATAKSHLHFGRKAIKAAILDDEQTENKRYTGLPLPVLTKLKELNPGGNNIPHLSPIEGMLNLVDMGVYSDQISDISVVANTTKPESPEVATNPACDLSPACYVPNVTRSAQPMMPFRIMGNFSGKKEISKCCACEGINLAADASY